jgi:hypothetical protein
MRVYRCVQDLLGYDVQLFQHISIHPIVVVGTEIFPMDSKLLYLFVGRKKEEARNSRGIEIYLKQWH